MRKLIHFPLNSDTFGHQFGIKSLDKENQITIRTDGYKDDISLKNELINEDPDYYSVSTDRSKKSEEEASILLINKRNSLLETAKSLQEDLVILSGDSNLGHPIIAGVVCFPNGWAIREKFGM